MNLQGLTEIGVIVAADEELDCLVLWNEDTKFELFRRQKDGTWRCCDWFSCGVVGVPHARQRAKEYLADISIRYRWARVA